ncbi:MAG: NAD(P)-dependent oxidoreductase [Phycisphaerales bacterium]|nr:NAD(P)-dependent oxidoreductase [Phycisphaerales bacterium]
MNIALTGTSGFIGAAIAREATRAGHRVQGLVRSTSRVDHLEPWVDRLVVGTHDDARAREELLEGADAVIHNSFDWPALRDGDLHGHMRSNMLGSIDLLQAAGERPFIYISSVAVHHHMHEQWDGRIDGLHPTRPGTFYGALKASVEAHMWAAHAERGQPVDALRPCAVYGIDPNLSRSIGWPIIEKIRNREPFTRAGGGKFVHVDDVAAATVACVDRPADSPRIHHLVDCYARWADWAMITAELLGIEDAEIDDSSPTAPRNMFEVDDVRSELGVAMDRGFDGIRAHLGALIELQSKAASS